MDSENKSHLSSYCWNDPVLLKFEEAARKIALEDLKAEAAAAAAEEQNAPIAGTDQKDNYLQRDCKE